MFYRVKRHFRSSICSSSTLYFSFLPKTSKKNKYNKQNYPLEFRTNSNTSFLGRLSLSLFFITLFLYFLSSFFKNYSPLQPDSIFPHRWKDNINLPSGCTHTSMFTRLPYRPTCYSIKNNLTLIKNIFCALFSN